MSSVIILQRRKHDALPAADTGRRDPISLYKQGQLMARAQRFFPCWGASELADTPMLRVAPLHPTLFNRYERAVSIQYGHETTD